MGCCQSESMTNLQNQHDYKTEIVSYEKRDDDYTSANNNHSAYNMPPSNLFAPEDNFYIDSVERYNVKYKPPVV
jgi:hypothetical protein